MTNDLEAAREWVAARVRSDMSREARLRLVVDGLWEALGEPAGGRVSWVGFYLPDEDGTKLVLGPSRNKPACSPIGLHGVCGQAYVTGRPQVVRDVRKLGEAYVACDPADLSELVYPVLDEDDYCWAVLDFDSHREGAFDEDDLDGVRRVLEAAKLI